MQALIREILASFAIEDYQPIIKRALDMGKPLAPRKGNLVRVIKGMRRCGKSYRMFQEIESLLSSGIPQDQICYFNFEDDRLVPITPAVGDAVLEAFYSQNPQALKSGAYLFFDEIQEMADWGKWLRRVVDTYKATIYVTGSSSKLLSEDISTEFRGRAIDFELLPFSFAEYVSAVLPAFNPAKKRRSMQEKYELRAAFSDYLRQGGFPATQGLPRAQQVALLQSYVQQVVLRDVVERNSLSAPKVASVLAQRILSTNAMMLSVRKIEADLRASGMKTSRETLSKCVDYFEAAYMVFAVRTFSYAISDAPSPVKVYAVDPGLALANARANSNNAGQRLENAVYLELRRRRATGRAGEICTYKTRVGGYEVDFIVGDAAFGELYELYQVAENVTDAATLNRELRALWEAMDDAGVSEAHLIVGEGAATEYRQGAKVVYQHPAWEWFL